MKNYLRLLQFLKGYERLFVVAVFFMVLASLFEGFQLPLLVPMIDRIFSGKEIVIPNDLPGFVANFVNYINSMDQMTAFKYFPIAAMLIILLKHFFIYWYTYFMSDISQRVMRDVRNNLYDKIQNLSLDYFSKKRTGELISRITYDVNVIENAVSYAVIDLFRQSLMIFIHLVIAFGIYPQAALIIFLVFPLVGFPMNQIGKLLNKISKDVQERMADINSHLLETISGIQVVKAFNAEKYETNRFKDKNQDFYKLKMKSVKRILLIGPITEIIGTISGLCIFLWMGYKVMRGEISLGVFILFFGSIMSLISPIKKLGNVNALIQQALAANDRIYDVLDADITVKEKPDAVDLPEMKQVISIVGVTFHYYKEAGLVLKDINLEVKKGELVAIVGPTGTGKTTLANLIPRLYDPTEGSVQIDGVDLKNVTFRSLREQIGVVTQETILFNDTVKANIAYGHREATQEDIEEAARKAFAHRFTVTMPEGYGTIIGDRGFRLSGGEKQRISIARAILKNPPILILDEATSQLDSESEKFVQEALDKLMQGRTVVAIAHRLSTIKKADKIVVIDQGCIAGVGKHNELLKTCPLYKKLHSMQFQI